MSVTVFPKIYEKYSAILNESNLDNVIYIEGKMDNDGEKQVLIADTISELNSLPKTVYVRFHDMQDYLMNQEYIDAFIRTHAGNKNDNIFIYLDTEKQGKLIHGCFGLNHAGIVELQDKFSDERVRVKI